MRLETTHAQVPTAQSQVTSSSGVHDDWMPAVPEHIRGRIRSGMRWTVYLSALAAPFSYGTTVLLARVSPRTISSYGLLLIYVSLVSSLFYLGGDAVIINFWPALEESKRRRFLVSYYLVVCLSLLPWLALAVLFPRALHYVFGRQISNSFVLFVLLLSPIPILLFMLRAAFKAALDFRRAQLLARLVTIGSFMTYIVLFFFWRVWLDRHPVEIVWSVYLILTAIGIVAGVLWLRGGSHVKIRRQPGRARFWLPRGFVSYTLGTQQISLLNFFLQRLDYILVLDLGGVKVLGEYVVITTLALYIPLVSSYFYDTLLPSLTNVLAAGDCRAAAEVYRTHMRLIMLVVAVGTCSLVFLSSPLLAIFGPAYKGLWLPVLALSALVGLAGPGGSGATLLSAIGKPQRAVWVNLIQVGVFVGLFADLWPRLGLLGAALALGVSTLVGSLLVLVVGVRSARLPTGISHDYVKLCAIICVAALGEWYVHIQGWATGLLACGLSVCLFLVIAGYRRTECHDLWRWVVPSHLEFRWPWSHTPARFGQE